MWNRRVADKYTLMVPYDTERLRSAQKYLRVSSDAGMMGILYLVQKEVYARTPAWYVRWVDAATPEAYRLISRR